MADNATIKVTKLDAAKRQLRTAIKLWFIDGDPVSVHTLVFAAHEIVHTLFRRKGLNGLMFDSDLIRDEHRGDFAKLMKEHATFFKHAQKDPDGEIDFNPDVNEYLISFMLYGLHRMGEPLDNIDHTFTAWLLLHRPNLFLKDILGERMPGQSLDELRGLEKGRFFETYQLALRTQRRVHTAR